MVKGRRPAETGELSSAKTQRLCENIRSDEFIRLCAPKKRINSLLRRLTVVAPTGFHTVSSVEWLGRRTIGNRFNSLSDRRGKLLKQLRPDRRQCQHLNELR